MHLNVGGTQGTEDKHFSIRTIYVLAFGILGLAGTLFSTILTAHSVDSIKVAHVYVALCDNTYQGIVPVPKNLGDGQAPATNLYWGARYGVKTFLSSSRCDHPFLYVASSELPREK